MKPSQVDIIIPVHNRLEHTIQTLDSLIKNTPHDAFNLYVIDDKSNDHVYGELESYARKSAKQFELFHNIENIGPGATRNFICKEIIKKDMRSKYLYHSDNDVYFKENWLQILTDIYKTVENKGIKILGASCHPYLQNSSQINLIGSPYIQCVVGIKDAVSGYSQLMTWETWDTFGPFDETMRGQEKKIMGSEDWAFCQKIIKAGFKVGSVQPEVVVPCGKTNTYGDPATGSETFKNVAGVMVK